MVDDNWTPTPANINALPEPLRRYIMELETLCDPVGIVAENVRTKDNANMLSMANDELKAENVRLRAVLTKIASCECPLPFVNIQDFTSRR